MARIRSIHPGFFNDERVVSVTLMARLFLQGLWCEADDQGVFEWRPLSLKMRIFPADNADADALLSELISAELITMYAVDGRKYGAVRNFCRFQKPRRPHKTHPMTDEIRQYVRWSDEDTDDDGKEAASTGSIPAIVGKASSNGEGVGEGEGSKSSPASRPTYAFKGEVIKLKRADFEKWQGTFNAIPDLQAELTSLDAWISRQGLVERKKWFHIIAGSLAKKHQKILTDRAAPKASGPPTFVPGAI